MPKTALYRHFDATGALLYVGISLSAVARLAAHRGSEWSGEIASMTVQTFPSRAEAAEAEQRAIRAERPIYNRQRYGGEPPAPPPPPEPRFRRQLVDPADLPPALTIISPARRRMFAEGKLKPLDVVKWNAGGYGPDPFGIAARASAARTPEVPA